VRACEIPVLELERPGGREAITEECARAVAEDGADAIVLGCAGMADLCADISARIGVPVVDGVAAGVRTVETLVALGLATGARGEFAPPPAKPYTGLLADFQMP
jgi:allantoin racemase